MNSTDDIARRAAARLSLELDPNLPALTEGAIAERGASIVEQGPAPMRDVGTFLDPANGASIAAVILAASQFAYQIYRDWKTDRDKEKDQAPPPATPPRDLVVRRLRLEFPALQEVPGRQLPQQGNNFAASRRSEGRRDLVSKVSTDQ